MEETLEAALARLFGGTAGPRAQPNVTATAANQQPGAASTQAAAPAAALSPQLSAVAEEAQAHYQRAIDAQRAGDWAKYGEEIKALGQALDRMKPR